MDTFPHHATITVRKYSDNAFSVFNGGNQVGVYKTERGAMAASAREFEQDVKPRLLNVEELVHGEVFTSDAGKTWFEKGNNNNNVKGEVLLRRDFAKKRGLV